MDRELFMTIIFIGLGCLFVPLVIVGLTFMDPGSGWETVGQQVALPIMAIFILGIMFLFLYDVLRG